MKVQGSPFRVLASGSEGPRSRVKDLGPEYEFLGIILLILPALP